MIDPGTMVLLMVILVNAVALVALLIRGARKMCKEWRKRGQPE